MTSRSALRSALLRGCHPWLGWLCIKASPACCLHASATARPKYSGLKLALPRRLLKYFVGGDYLLRSFELASVHFEYELIRLIMHLVWGGFYVHWSSVRSTEATFTTPATLPAWTNPTTCLGGAAQCGHIAIAIPVSEPSGRPEAWVLD